ncbi:MAG: phosphoglucomutase/phosphomannomutase family protein, partial [Dehalococcoidia bacterium]
MSEIHFGTDGWRAQIAEEFTFDNVRLVAQATAEHLLRTGDAAKGVVIGYDTRFLSQSFAGAVAEVLAGNGIRCAIASSAGPTPALSHSIVHRGAGAGIMITASHNPGRYNGFKVKESYGSSSPPAVTRAIEDAIDGIVAANGVRRMALGEAQAKGLVEEFDQRGPYLAALRQLVDIEAIKAAGLRVLVDSMYGAGLGVTAELLAGGATTVEELHGYRNPAFPGMRAPEPIGPNLGEQLGVLAQGGFDVGLSTDGDADRVGIADERGRFITQLQTMALLVHYLVGVRGERGPMVRSVTMTRMVDRLGERYDCPVYETPVGFVHLGPKMMETNALIAGEESGGYAFRGHIPERDGVLSGLLILEAMVKTGRKPSELLQAVYDEIGTHEYDRIDITLRGDERDAIRDRVAQAQPEQVAGLRVESKDTVDGFRFNLEGGWWLLLRFSGTEPLLRIYAEMPTMEHVRQALQAG